MARRLAGLTGALALLLGATTAGAQGEPPPPAAGVPVSQLTGLDPAAVRGRLADVPAAWPIPPAFQLATGDGLLSFVTVQDLMTDPVLAEQAAVFRTHGDLVPPAPYLQCREVLTRGGSLEQGAGVVLMFRNGRLEAAFLPVEVAHPPPPNLSDRKAMHAWLRRPGSSVFIAALGELPLEDGAGFMSRWAMTALAPDDRLSAACAPPTPPPTRPPTPRHGLDASDWQGLSLLPFAVTLPGKNRQRVAAHRQGATLLATLHVGERLGSAPEAFAADHPGVRAYRAKQGDYAVLSLDLGGYPGRNLTNFNDTALLGVRNGRIEWLSQPPGLGPQADLLCLDERGVAGTPRPGCSGWGHFSP
ncbi:MAG: hypothetical protein E7812_11065 [Phenylobacterium sp.]|nr:MAG: hypothetical protein E7812_11065 [Phenylobacterium sp.]